MGTVAQAQTRQQLLRTVRTVALHAAGVSRRNFHILGRGDLRQQIEALKHEAERPAAQCREFV